MKNSNALTLLLQCCYALSAEALPELFPTKPSPFLGFPVSVNDPRAASAQARNRGVSLMSPSLHLP